MIPGVKRALSATALVVLATAATLGGLELGAYAVLRLAPRTYQPFESIAWMRDSFHPLWTSGAPDPFTYWPFLGYFHRPQWQRPPAGLPEPFPEAHVFFDHWGRTTPLEKGPRELRVFVLGGSTMAGMGASSAEATVPGRLEHWLRLRLPKGSAWTLRVVNAGVVGYTSTQEQALMATRLLQYRPDVFVVVDGYNEFTELWNAPNLPPFWNSYEKHLYQGFARMQSPLGMAAQAGYLASKRLYSLALPRAYLSHRARRAGRSASAPAAPGVPAAPAPAEQALEVYRWNIRTMLGIAEGHGIPMLLALQPTLSYDKPLSPEEEAILRVPEAAGNPGWSPAVARMFERLRALVRAEAKVRGGRVIDESGRFSGSRETLYVDQCHYNDRGADLLARALSGPVYAALSKRVGGL